MGLDTGNYFDKNVEIDLKELLEFLTVKDWYQIVKGFLNVWEFLFLFSIIESTLKEVLENHSEYTSELINDIDRKHPNLLQNLESNNNTSVELSKDIWVLYTSLRNLYSHTHGVISEDNRRKIAKKIKVFRKSYNKSFHSGDDLILSSLLKESGELFNGSKFKVGKFYLIEDVELNIFRNFSSKLMFSLNQIIVEEKA